MTDRKKRSSKQDLSLPPRLPVVLSPTGLRPVVDPIPEQCSRKRRKRMTDRKKRSRKEKKWISLDNMMGKALCILLVVILTVGSSSLNFSSVSSAERTESLSPAAFALAIASIFSGKLVYATA